MADLLPTQDESGDVVAQAPQYRVSAGDYARSGSFLANGLEQFSEGLNAVAVPLAQKAAADDLASGSITRDAQGNIQVQRQGFGLPILGPAGKAYQDAVAAGTLADGDNQASRDIAQLRAQHEGDPAGFQTAVNAYAQGIRARNPGVLGQSMYEAASQLGTQYYTGMVNQKATVDVGNAKTAINDAMTAKFNVLASLAQQGKTDSPDYAQAMREYSALGQQLVANPAFGVSAAVQKSNDDANRSLLLGYAVAGHVDKQWNGPGGIVAARQSLHDSLADPKLGLSPAQQAQLTSVGEARIQYLVGQNAAAVAANTENVSALEQAAKKNPGDGALTPQIWQAALANSQAVGDTVTTARLAAMYSVWQQQNATRTLAPNQSLVQQGVAPTSPTPGPAAGLPVSTPEGMAAYKARTAQIESSNGGTSSNVYQFQPGTWASLGGGNINDRATQEVQMDKLTAENRTQLAAALGRDPTPAELYLAHQQGWQGAINLMRNPTARAGSVVGDAAILGNGGNPNGTAADFVNLWQAKYNKTAAPVSAPGGLAFTPQQYQQNPFLLSRQVIAIVSDQNNRADYGEKLGASILQRMNNGFVPAPETMANYVQIAGNEPRLQEQASHVQAALEGLVHAENAINLPPGQGQAYIDHVRDLAQASGSLYQMEVAEQAKSFYEKSVEHLRSDPWGTAISKGWDGGKGYPQPLQFDNQLGLGAALHQRSDLATSIAARTGDNSLPALAPAEVDQVKSLLTNGSPQQIANFAWGVSTLPEARQKATWAAVAKTGQDGQVLAAAGALSQENPQASQDIIAGQQLLKSNANLAASSDKMGAALMPLMPTRDFQGTARDAVFGATTALYAKMSADANDTSGALNSTRFKQAFDSVTGGMVANKGSQLFPPWYQAGQAGFTAALGAVTDADMANSVTRDGTPLPASALKPSFLGWGGFKLENAGLGNGIYRIYTGTPDAKAYVMDRRGGPFLLDLGAKRADVDAASAGAAQPMQRFLSTPLQPGDAPQAKIGGSWLPLATSKIPTP